MMTILRMAFVSFMTWVVIWGSWIMARIVEELGIASPFASWEGCAIYIVIFWHIWRTTE